MRAQAASTTASAAARHCRTARGLAQDIRESDAELKAFLADLSAIWNSSLA
jgi:hypothetical protein